MPAWHDDPRLLNADCEAEDRFVYTLTELLVRSEVPHQACPHRLHAFAQALLDRAAERSCLPRALDEEELRHAAAMAGVAPATVHRALRAVRWGCSHKARRGCCVRSGVVGSRLPCSHLAA